jgi:hypothetical protein
MDAEEILASFPSESEGESTGICDGTQPMPDEESSQLAAAFNAQAVRPEDRFLFTI